jgi:hypothetical protein
VVCCEGWFLSWLPCLPSSIAVGFFCLGVQLASLLSAKNKLCETFVSHKVFLREETSQPRTLGFFALPPSSPLFVALRSLSCFCVVVSLLLSFVVVSRLLVLCCFFCLVCILTSENPSLFFWCVLSLRSRYNIPLPCQQA